MYELRKINEEDLDLTLKKKLIKEAIVIYKPTFEWYALYDNDTMLTIIAVSFRKTNYRIEAIYTISEYRGYGLGTVALKQMIDILDSQYDITADCLDSSISMFKKCGFELIKSLELKICNLHKCIYRRRK